MSFDVLVPPDAEPGKHVIQAKALYYACRTKVGECMYLRQPLKIVLQVRAAEETAR